RFGANILEECPRLRRPFTDPAAVAARALSFTLGAFVFGIGRNGIFHLGLTHPDSPDRQSPWRWLLAGAEGVEPPHPVLETGGLPLNLRPYSPTVSRQSICAAAPTSGRQALANFAVNCMMPASTAKLLEFQPRRRLFLILGGRVIPVLAIRTL